MSPSGAKTCPGEHGTEADFALHLRVPVTLQGTLQSPGRASVDVRIRNLSLRGALIESRFPPRPGQPCVLGLDLEGENVHVRAMMVWARSARAPEDPADEGLGWLAGLRFLSVPTPTDPRLRKYLATLAKERPLAQVDY